MSPGRTAERVYTLLKSQIVGGERRAGERLDPARLAAELHASATPVRDALHRLLGERMVEAWPHEGFKVPVPTEAGLHDLYGWNGDLADTLLRSSTSEELTRKAAPPPRSGEPADDARAFFAAIANTFGGGEHRAAIAQASDRLHRARAAEAELFADLWAEQGALIDAWSASRLAELRASVAFYHRRRQKHVAQIIARMLTTDRPG